VEPGGVFPRQRDGQTAVPGGLTDSATGSSYFIQWPWRPNNYERSADSYRAVHAPTANQQDANRPRAYRILRLCATDNYRTICVGGLFSERDRHESTGARPPPAFPRTILLGVYVSTVSNLIDNLSLGSHVGTPAADVASVASRSAR